MIHLIWIGGELPTLGNINLVRWKKKYGSEVHLWDDFKILEFNNQILNKSDLPFAMRVDSLRVDVIRKYGGWYLDMDTFPGNLALPTSKKIILVPEESKRFCNGIFFAPKEHPFLTHWQEEIKNSISEMWPFSNHVPTISGPHALTRALYTYALKHGIKVVQNEISYLPLGWVLFADNKSKVANSKFLLNRKGVVHVSWQSWRQQSTGLVKTNIRSYSFLYRLRQSSCAFFLDLIRSILKNPKYIPNQKWKIELLKNLDNRVLDSKTNFKEFWVQIDSIEELYPRVRDNAIGGIRTQDTQISEKLKYAGWIQFKGIGWIRPNLKELLSEHLK